jgi:hypothetical protein
MAPNSPICDVMMVHTCEVAHSLNFKTAPAHRYNPNLNSKPGLIIEMPKKRKKDPQTGTHFRSERIVKESDKWYFTTREGTIQGPYPTRENCESELEEYVKIKIADDNGELTLEPRVPLLT